jgi:hypothetical protein
MAMTALRKIWKPGHLIIVMIVTVPGVLMLFQEWGYLADGTTTPAKPMATGFFVARSRW